MPVAMQKEQEDYSRTYEMEIRKRLRSNKKNGSIQDVLFIIISLVVLTVATLLVYKVMNEVNQKMQDNSDITDNGKNAMNQLENNFTGVLDNSFMLLVIGLSIVAISLAAMVRVHPVFFVFFIILLVIIVFLSGIFSNIYQKVASNEMMVDADGSGVLLADKLTFMTYTMRFLPFLTGVIGFVMAFIMYKSSQAG